ncbi:MAG: hypothetical protein ACREA4_04475 [Nitrososphaera sp.]
MPEMVDSLKKIADILAEQSFLETTTGHVVILVLGALIGGYLTYLFGKWHQKDIDARRKTEEQKKKIEDRHLLTVLLGDEIVLRWTDQIGGDLKKYLGDFSLDNISELCDITFLPHDLYIFQQCAQDVFESNLFEDGPLVSHLVYVHTLSKDLADGLKAVKSLAEEYRKTNNQLNAIGEAGNEFRDALERQKKSHVERLRSAWDSLKRIFQMLDAQMMRIYTHIEKDYRSCVGSSAFVQRPHEHAPDTEKRISEAIAERKHFAGAI